MCSSSLYSRPPRMFPPWLYRFHAMSSCFQCNAFVTRSLFLFGVWCKKDAQNAISASASSSVRNPSLTAKSLVAQPSINKNHSNTIHVPWKANHLSYRLVYEPPFFLHVSSKGYHHPKEHFQDVVNYIVCPPRKFLIIFGRQNLISLHSQAQVLEHLAKLHFV